MTPENSRRDEILQHLAHMLEATPGGRITTAALAAQVGVSEAALYRHFPSKAKMFEALIAFIEDTLFTRIARIRREGGDAIAQCGEILGLLLGFCGRNPGITRLLTGDALAGENERLRARMLQFFDRLETELRTVLREAEPREGLRTAIPAAQAANLLLAAAEGRIAQFVRSDFRRNPSEQWAEQWRLLAAATFRRPEAP
jgi:TetR/AcrR family transcriptional regulator